MREDRTPSELERECEEWNWARTAGMSAEELRECLKSASGSTQALPPKIARAA